MTCYLVTGAAGLLGGEISAALAAQGDSVIGLVRKNRILRHGSGLELPTIEWIAGLPQPGTVQIVTGDVADPALGLSPASYGELADTIDCIIHCAALVEFDADEADYQAINVDGTRHVLDLARARTNSPAAMVQVSTAYVCGERDGEIAEDDVQSPKGFTNPYEASKFASEALVREAMADGIPAAIARPSIVVGRAGDGVIAGFDSIYMAFKLLAEGRIRTIPSTRDATLNFVPIDHVVNGIVTIAARIGDAHGQAFHLVAGTPMPVAEFFSLVQSYPQFSNPEQVEPDQFDPDTLSPIERRFHRRVAALYTSYFQRNPLFLQDNIVGLIGSAGPDADRGLMSRQIDFAVGAGFLPRESVNA